MPRDLRTIAFVIEEFSVPTPAQQLLDRFLIGYPRDGELHRIEGRRVLAYLAPGGSNTDLDRRGTDFGLGIVASVAGACAEAEAIVVVWRGGGAVANEALLREVLSNARPGAICFVHGVLAAGVEGARALEALAASRRVALLAGSPLGVTWRLPQIGVPLGTGLNAAIAVTQGAAMDAEFDGLECLAPVIERRRGGETGARRVKFLEGAEVWRAGEKGEWSWPLLAAALSRSDSPQGDPVKDGRTQDLAGLGLVPKLATAPRVFLIEHLDGFRSAVMALDGVVADYNFATSSSDGVTWSAQIYRAPLPAQHHYSLLAEVMERYFRGEAPLIGSPAAGTTAVSARDGAPPWSLDRGVFVAGLIEAGRRARQTPGSWVETPGLKLPGRA